MQQEFHPSASTGRAEQAHPDFPLSGASGARKCTQGLLGRGLLPPQIDLCSRAIQIGGHGRVLFGGATAGPAKCRPSSCALRRFNQELTYTPA